MAVDSASATLILKVLIERLGDGPKARLWIGCCRDAELLGPARSTARMSELTCVSAWLNGPIWLVLPARTRGELLRRKVELVVDVRELHRSLEFATDQ